MSRITSYLLKFNPIIVSWLCSMTVLSYCMLAYGADASLAQTATSTTALVPRLAWAGSTMAILAYITPLWRQLEGKWNLAGEAWTIWVNAGLASLSGGLQIILDGAPIWQGVLTALLGFMTAVPSLRDIIVKRLWAKKATLISDIK